MAPVLLAAHATTASSASETLESLAEAGPAGARGDSGSAGPRAATSEAITTSFFTTGCKAERSACRKGHRDATRVQQLRGLDLPQDLLRLRKQPAGAAGTGIAQRSGSRSSRRPTSSRRIQPVASSSAFAGTSALAAASALTARSTRRNHGVGEWRSRRALFAQSSSLALECGECSLADQGERLPPERSRVTT